MAITHIVELGPLPKHYGNCETRSVNYYNRPPSDPHREQFTAVLYYGKMHYGNMKYRTEQFAEVRFYRTFEDGAQPFHVEVLDLPTSRGFLNAELVIDGDHLAVYALTDTGSSIHVHEKKQVVFHLTAKVFTE